jgi:hypothetical protein
LKSSPSYTIYLHVIWNEVLESSTTKHWGQRKKKPVYGPDAMGSPRSIVLQKKQCIPPG